MIEVLCCLQFFSLYCVPSSAIPKRCAILLKRSLLSVSCRLGFPEEHFLSLRIIAHPPAPNLPRAPPSCLISWGNQGPPEPEKIVSPRRRGVPFSVPRERGILQGSLRPHNLLYSLLVRKVTAVMERSSVRVVMQPFVHAVHRTSCVT